jgi:DNA (cytosine-5)-methyltransferase 1
MRIGSLCTGYGGIELGLTLAGERPDVQWIAETNTGLAALHSAPNLGDLRSVDWSAVEPVDLLTAGFPCQPVSAAGRQRGKADDRWLWPEVARAVGELAPVRVLLENVRNLISLHKGELWAGILADLAALGYDVRWLTLGACRVGMAHHRHRMFALATRAPANRPALPAQRLTVAECGLKAPLIGLPTPAARDGDGRGEGDQEYWSKRAETRANGLPLGAAVALLPTPTERDNTRHGGGIGHGTTGGPNLRTVAAWELMPTPRATDGVNGGPNQRGRRGDLAVPSAVQPERWGRFVDAVARQACILDREPPEPTEPNRNGAPRLSPAFAEWLMAIPAGHVTGTLGRNDALMAIGNGVCPPQCAAAWEILRG